MQVELASDHIGRIGERKFEMLCELAGLYCNKSIIDVMGWDFIVEFPLLTAGQPLLPLDERATNAARIQLKTTLGRAGNRIRLSLSAIERLAKDPRPALIIVFRLRADGELQSAYLVHLIGSELGRVLKRLRLAESRKDYDINHTDISYDYEKVGLRVEPTAAGLKAALTAVCGQEPGAYTLEKQRQLKELGYEDGRFEAEALLQIEGPEHLRSILLGLTPLKPHRLDVFDNRFGIRLPYQGTLFDDIEELRLTPPTMGTCEILIRGPGFEKAARFDGEVFVGPLIAGQPELLIRSPDFIIRLTPEGLTFSTTDSIDDLERNLDEWAELLRALTLMTSGRATLTIAGNDRLAPTTFPVDQPIDGPYLYEVPLFSSFLSGWLRLLANAGVRSTAKFRFEEFWNANEAAMAVDILLNSPSRARFDFHRLGTDEESPPPHGLYFNSVTFADATVTFSARVIFEKTDDPEWPYKSASFEALDVRPKVGDLEEYGVDQLTASDLSLLLDPRNITLVSGSSMDDLGMVTDR